MIAEEIRQWSETVLEISSDDFNGLPPCPYAKQAWMQDKVRMHVTEDIDSCIQIKKDCPDDDSVDVVASEDCPV